MSVGDARHGRRDNGLVAAEYAPAGDVDPRVGEHLLDVLALDGIAAYLRPSTDLHPVTRSTVLPSRPTDRLFVDRVHIATAQEYLSQLARDAEQADRAAAEQDEAEPPPSGSPDPASNSPTDSNGTDGPAGRDSTDATAPAARRMSEPSSDDVDRAWAEIIAGYDTTASPRWRSEATEPSTGSAATGPDVARPDYPWPGQIRPDGSKPDPTRPDATRPDPTRPDVTRPDVTRPESTRPDATRDAQPDRDADRIPPYRLGPRMSSRPLRGDEPSLLDGLDTFGAGLPDDGDDTFTPPVPPPVPRPSLPTALAVIGVVGGLAVFLKPALLGFIDESLAMFLGFTAIVSGFGTLVWRLRPGDDEETDDPDQGAKV